MGGWLVVGSLEGEKAAWGRRTEDSFRDERGKGDIGTGWDSGVGMEIDMTGMGLESLSQACSKRCTYVLEYVWSIYERRLAATDRSIESRLVSEGPVRTRKERSWRHEWLRIAGALAPLIGKKKLVVTVGNATMRSGRWEGQYKLLEVCTCCAASCALRQHYERSRYREYVDLDAGSGGKQMDTGER